MADVRSHNREAWNRLVEASDPWTVPVTAEEIAAARRGEVRIVLTPRKPIPGAWLGDLPGSRVLCLASGGGQQGPILAAAGAEVTVFDNAPAQLARDREVAEREGLSLRTLEGDMRDLSAFAGESFDLIVHPCSNLFVDDVRPVWWEAHRVLARGGALLAGLCNPMLFCLDPALEEEGILQIKHAAPFSPFTSLTEPERRRLIDAGEAFEFGHTFDDLVGGQLEAGFLLSGWYDDLGSEGAVFNDYLPLFHATRAIKP